MSAPKPYETRPDDPLIESPEIPGLWWNMRTGLVCNKDGKLLTMKPNMPGFPTMTTDPQAPYGDKPTTEQREPLLSLAHFNRNDMCAFTVVEKVRDFYEAKITSGELRVVRKIRPDWKMDPDGRFGTWECECHEKWDTNTTPEVGEFCKCGAKIIE